MAPEKHVRNLADSMDISPKPDGPVLDKRDPGNAL